MDNPYQPPAAPEEPLLPGAELKDTRVLALVSLWLYAISIVAEITAHILRTYVDRSFVGSDLHDSHDVTQPGIVDGIMVLSTLSSSVVYLFWKYRAARNALVLDPASMKVSPAMAVGSYFIPLVNFVVPCKAMAGISRATLGNIGGVGLWWVGQLGSLVLEITAGIMGDPALDELSLAGHGLVVWNAMTFLVSWWLVMRITRVQSAKCGV